MCVALSNRHQIRPNICVDTNDVRFLKQVDSDLTLLESQEVGKRLITRISGGKHAVYISKGISDEAIALDSLAARTRGVGCSSKITYSLKADQLVDSRGKVHTTPAFLGLAHELIHAYHSANGKNARTEDLAECSRSWWSNREEIHTIKGFPSKNPSRSKPKISENAIRKEHGYPERFGHISALDDSKMQSSPLKLDITAQLVTDVFFRTIMNPHSSPPVVPLMRMPSLAPARLHFVEPERVKGVLQKRELGDPSR